jgi:hypothetical protein
MVCVRIKYINGTLLACTVNDWIVPVLHILIGKLVVIRRDSDMMVAVCSAKDLHAGTVGL